MVLSYYILFDPSELETWVLFSWQQYFFELVRIITSRMVQSLVVHYSISCYRYELCFVASITSMSWWSTLWCRIIVSTSFISSCSIMFSATQNRWWVKKYIFNTISLLWKFRKVWGFSADRYRLWRRKKGFYWPHKKVSAVDLSGLFDAVFGGSLPTGSSTRTWHVEGKTNSSHHYILVRVWLFVMFRRIIF